MPIRSVLRSPLRSVLRPTIGEGVGGFDYLATDGQALPFTVATTPSGVYDSNTDKTWFFWDAWNGDLPLRVNVRVYDHATATWSEIWTAGLSPLTNEDHGVPAAFRDAGGYWHVFFGSHNSPLQHWVTAAPDDPSLFVRQTAVDSDSAGLYTYAHPNLVGSAVYLFLRDTTDAADYSLVLKKGTISAGVVTWDAKVEVGKFGDGDSRWYQGTNVVRGTDIHMLATKALLNDTKRQNVYYLIYDTLTGSVKNFDGSATVASGSFPIDLSTLNTSFRVVDQITGGTDGNVPALCFDAADHPHIAYMDGTSGGGWSLKHTMHDGSSWTSPATVGAFASNNILHRYDGFTVAPGQDGGVEAWWVTASAFAFTRGGDISRRKRSSGGVWGSAEVIRAAGATYGLDSPVMIRGGHSSARVMFCEATGDATIEAGDLKIFAYGDAGYLRSRADSKFAFWKPSDLGAKLVRWFQSNDEAYLTQVSGVVSHWKSKTSGSPSVSQGTAGSRPAHSRTGLNGNRPGITADGTADILTGTSPVGVDTPSFYFVAKRGTQGDSPSSGGRGIINFARASDNVVFSIGVLRPTVDAAQTIMQINGQGTGSASAQVTGFTNGTTALFAAKMSTMSLSMNGGTPVTGAALGNAFIGANLCIFGDENNAVRRFAGVIPEIIMTDGTETTAQGQQIEGYLAWAAGIQTSLPSGHPYRNVRP